MTVQLLSMVLNVMSFPIPRIPVPDVCVDDVSDMKAPAASMFSQSSSYPHSDGEWSPLQRYFFC